MSDVQIRDMTLIEKLKKEVRLCSGCSLEVRHPLVERCPRCYAPLPRMELGCQGCFHRTQCPIAGAHPKEVFATSPPPILQL